jgi:hypothetical protein
VNPNLNYSMWMRTMHQCTDIVSSVLIIGCVDGGGEYACGRENE